MTSFSLYEIVLLKHHNLVNKFPLSPLSFRFHSRFAIIACIYIIDRESRSLVYVIMLSSANISIATNYL